MSNIQTLERLERKESGKLKFLNRGKGNRSGHPFREAIQTILCVVPGDDLGAGVHNSVVLLTFQNRGVRRHCGCTAGAGTVSCGDRVCVCETDLPVECIEHLDALVEWGAQGIALCALNDILIETKVGELADRGIPCITLNSDLPNSRRLCFVGQDYTKSGRIAAELLSKCVPHDARILAMVGNLEYHGHRTRLDGFCARMHELGFTAAQIEITETYNNYRLTCDKVRQALHDLPDLAAIYMVNRSVTGCTDALRQAGMTDRIRVVAHDLSARTKLLLQEGSLDFTITQDMYRQGYLPLILLRELLHKGTPPQEDQIGTSISIICSQNID